MKYTKILLLLTSFCLFLAACVKDDTNYDYNEVNDVVVSGIEEKYTINMLDTLRITPVLEGVVGTLDESNLEFLWDIFEGLNSPQRFPEPDTLSTERNLVIPITYIPDNYRMNFKVKDKTTGVLYRYQFDVQVMSEFQRGLLALSDVDGNAVVSFMSVTGENYPNLYFNINGEHVGTNPVAIDILGRAPLDYVVIVCDDNRGGVYASTVSFVKMHDYSEYFYNAPAVIQPQGFKSTRFYSSVSDYREFVNRSFLVNNNKLHFKDLNHNVSVDGETVTVENKFYDAYPGDYEIASERFYGLDNIHFDNKHQQFMYIPSFNQPNLYVHDELADNPYFDPANVGMDFVWGRTGPAPRGQVLVNSLFKRPNGKLTFLRWRANFPSSGKVHPLQITEFPDEWQIHNATAFAGNMRQDYIYYAAGSGIYVFDRVANQERQVYDFGGSIVVDQLMYHEAFMSAEEMFVATSQGQGSMNGSIHRMGVAPGGVLSLVETHQNVTGKVVDLCWKN